MASLPAFDSFHQAAADEQVGSADAFNVQSMPPIGNHDSFSESSAGTAGSSLGYHSVQPSKQAESQVAPTLNADHRSLNTPQGYSTQQEEAPVVADLGKAGDGSLDSMLVHIATQKMEATASGVHNVADDGIHSRQEAQHIQETETAAYSTHAGSESSHINPTLPPVSLQALQQHAFTLGLGPQKLEKLQPESRPIPELPAVSINIMSSISFITVRIARFLLLPAMAPVALAIFLNLILGYPKPGRISNSTAFGVSILAVSASVLLLVATSMRTIIADKKAAKFENKTLHDFSKLAAASYLFVLGSGGHTAEMVSLIQLSQKPYRHTHRRYLITAGDNHSRGEANMLESKMASIQPAGSAGTSDLVTVTRARAVHQSYITSIFTSLKCFLEIADTLVNIPAARIGQPGAENFRSPHVIVTNGPGTGFIVGLVAFFLKVFHVVPRDRLKVVFVETWARAHSLGLTGKLFYLTQIADLFVVQSEELAEAINKPYIGNVNKMWADLANAASEDGRGAKQEGE